jgi:FkbM family methyltransferase
MYTGHNGRAGGIYGLCNTLAKNLNKPITSIIDLGSRHGEGYELFGINFCQLYTFVEPSPRCTPKIEELMARYPNAKFNMIPGILGQYDDAADLIMLESDGDQSANVFSNRGGQYGQSETVQVPVFSYDVLDDRYDFAKINIEGGEYDLIADGVFDKFDAFVLEAHNVHVPGKTYKDAIAGLQDAFDIVSYGDLGYKYCFLTGVRK